ncbi:hypothetical protein H9P43_005688 [Blastocladiella emersonii ATCC 22665]|nr:hypothetical protein H9P43_005688 [Blastocladiella emersonii ATCC 22665]
MTTISLAAATRSSVLDGLSVCSTGLEEAERERTSDTVHSLGGEYRKSMDRKVNVLLVPIAWLASRNIIPAPQRAKVIAAHKWRTPVVTTAWLQDCVRTGTRLDLAAYTPPWFNVPNDDPEFRVWRREAASSIAAARVSASAATLSGSSVASVVSSLPPPPVLPHIGEKTRSSSPADVARAAPAPAPAPAPRVGNGVGQNSARSRFRVISSTSSGSDTDDGDVVALRPPSAAAAAPPALPPAPQSAAEPAPRVPSARTPPVAQLSRNLAEAETPRNPAPGGAHSAVSSAVTSPAQLLAIPALPKIGPPAGDPNLPHFLNHCAFAAEFFPPDRVNLMRSLVESYGGTFLDLLPSGPASRSVYTAREWFLVLPLNCADLDVFTKKYDAKTTRLVTEYWLNDVLVVQLANVSMSLTGLEGKERDGYMEAMRALGIAVSEKFSRKQSYLVCAAARGSKFEKAVEWSVPAVKHKWIAEMIKSGLYLRPDPYTLRPPPVLDGTVLVISARTKAHPSLGQLRHSASLLGAKVLLAFAQQCTHVVDIAPGSPAPNMCSRPGTTAINSSGHPTPHIPSSGSNGKFGGSQGDGKAASNAHNSGDREVKLGRQNGKHIVSPWWVVECAQAHRRLPEAEYPPNYDPSRQLRLTRGVRPLEVYRVATETPARVYTTGHPHSAGSGVTTPSTTRSQKRGAAELDFGPAGAEAMLQWRTEVVPAARASATKRARTKGSVPASAAATPFTTPSAPARSRSAGAAVQSSRSTVAGSVTPARRYQQPGGGRLVDTPSRPAPIDASSFARDAWPGHSMFAAAAPVDYGAAEFHEQQHQDPLPPPPPSPPAPPPPQQNAYAGDEHAEREHAAMHDRVQRELEAILAQLPVVPGTAASPAAAVGSPDAVAVDAAAAAAAASDPSRKYDWSTLLPSPTYLTAPLADQTPLYSQPPSPPPQIRVYYDDPEAERNKRRLLALIDEASSSSASSSPAVAGAAHQPPRSSPPSMTLPSAGARGAVDDSASGPPTVVLPTAASASAVSSPAGVTTSILETGTAASGPSSVGSAATGRSKRRKRSIAEMDAELRSDSAAAGAGGDGSASTTTTTSVSVPLRQRRSRSDTTSVAGPAVDPATRANPGVGGGAESMQSDTSSAYVAAVDQPLVRRDGIAAAVGGGDPAGANGGGYPQLPNGAPANPVIEKRATTYQAEQQPRPRGFRIAISGLTPQRQHYENDTSLHMHIHAKLTLPYSPPRVLIQQLGGEFMLDGNMQSQWVPGTTHLVISIPITCEKCMCAIASGAWLLRPEYLDASYAAGRFLDEADYSWAALPPDQLTAIFERHGRVTLGFDPKKARDLIQGWRHWFERVHSFPQFHRGAFQDWRVWMLADSAKMLSSYRNLLIAGGASLVHSWDPDANPDAVTHVLTHNTALPPHLAAHPVVRSRTASAIIASNYLLRITEVPARTRSGGARRTGNTMKLLATLSTLLALVITLATAASGPVTDPTVLLIQPSTVPSCPVPVISAINTCLLLRASDRGSNCPRLNTAATQAQFHKCNCDFAHRSYICTNRPGCHGPTVTATAAENTAADVSKLKPDAGATLAADGITNGAIPAIRQFKLSLGMQVSASCRAAVAAGIDTVWVDPDERWVDQDAPTSAKKNSLEATTPAEGVQVFQPSSGAGALAMSGAGAAMVAVAAAIVGGV